MKYFSSAKIVSNFIEDEEKDAPIPVARCSRAWDKVSILYGWRAHPVTYTPMGMHMTRRVLH